MSGMGRGLSYLTTGQMKLETSLGASSEPPCKISWRFWQPWRSLTKWNPRSRHSPGPLQEDPTGTAVSAGAALQMRLVVDLCSASIIVACASLPSRLGESSVQIGTSDDRIRRCETRSLESPSSADHIGQMASPQRPEFLLATLSRPNIRPAKSGTTTHLTEHNRGLIASSLEH